jgi:hypothetical protein
MTITITRLYDDYASAERAVRDLEAAGVPHKDISIMSNNSDNWYNAGRAGDTGPGAPGATSAGRVDRDHDGVDDRAEGAGTGAGIGATVGGAAGLLAGLGLLAIPGLGPVVAAGWLASTALGALAGGTTGGVIGALSQAGVKDEDAQLYAEGLRRGGSLVSARVPDGDRSRYESVLNRSAVNLTERGTAYRKAGWNRFDPKAPPLSADQIRKERELYRRPSAA